MFGHHIRSFNAGYKFASKELFEENESLKSINEKLTIDRSEVKRQLDQQCARELELGMKIKDLESINKQLTKTKQKKQSLKPNHS